MKHSPGILLRHLVLMAAVMIILYVHGALNSGQANPVSFLHGIIVNDLANPSLYDLSLFRQLEMTEEQQKQLEALENHDLAVYQIFVSANTERFSLARVLIMTVSCLLTFAVYRLVQRHVLKTANPLNVFSWATVPSAVCSLLTLYLVNLVAVRIVLPLVRDAVFSLLISSNAELKMDIRFPSRPTAPEIAGVIFMGILRWLLAAAGYAVLIIALILEYDVLVLLVLNLVRSLTAPELSGAGNLLMSLILFTLLFVCTSLYEMLDEEKSGGLDSKLEAVGIKVKIQGLLLMASCLLTGLAGAVLSRFF